MKNTEKDFKSIELTLFRSYYNIFSGQINSVLLYYILIIFEAFQINGLIVFHILLKDLKPEIYQQLSSTLSLLRKICFMQDFDSYNSSVIILYISFIFTIVYYTNYAYNYYYEIDYKARKKFLNQIIMTMLYLLNMIVFKIFFIPLMTICFSFIECGNITNEVNLVNSTTLNATNTTNSTVIESDVNETLSVNPDQILHFLNYPSTICDTTTSKYSTTLIPAILTFIIINIQGFLNNLLFNDNRPFSLVPWSSRSSLSPYLMTILKISLSFFFVFEIKNFTYLEHIKIFLVLVITILLIIVRFFNIVMNHYYVFLVTTVLEGSFLFNAVISIINKYAKIELFIETFLVQYLASIFFGLLIFNIIDKLHQNSRDYNTSNIKSETLAYTHISLLTDLAKYCKHSIYHKSVFLGIFQKHRLKCDDSSCKCNQYTSVLNAEIWEKKEKTIQLAEEVQASTHILFSFDGYRETSTVFSSNAKLITTPKNKGKKGIITKQSNKFFKSGSTIQSQSAVEENDLLLTDESVEGIIELANINKGGYSNEEYHNVRIFLII